MSQHIEAIARAIKDLSYGELSMTQATDIATLAFNMSAEICAKACLDNNSADAIRALASEEG